MSKEKQKKKNRVTHCADYSCKNIIYKENKLYAKEGELSFDKTCTKYNKKSNIFVKRQYGIH